MEKKLKPSTQAISEEFHPRDKWVVIVNRKEYVLNGNQVGVLKEASQKNFRGIIWFKSFAISIPHIQEIYRKESGFDLENLDPLVRKALEEKEK